MSSVNRHFSSKVAKVIGGNGDVMFLLFLQEAQAAYLVVILSCSILPLPPFFPHNISAQFGKFSMPLPPHSQVCQTLRRFKAWVASMGKKGDKVTLCKLPSTRASQQKTYNT